MWDCKHCGSRMIAGTLVVCPQCRKARSPGSAETEPSEAVGEGSAEAVGSEISPSADATPTATPATPETGLGSELPPDAKGFTPPSAGPSEADPSAGGFLTKGWGELHAPR
jgi:hypothetical protein